ncbi:glycerol-3-phosphate dehydrogenase (NAD(P)+) [Rhodococcus sp. PvR044]|jgi:glycerol-3-phosphate dehydrogenase (NAD(P)+)|uniref:Glycerol-3-phosphate dehydrogenase [NAD(P)+] n=1 Tax=Rhodococcus oryzae TaxID=2571143 RepID=A0ABY2RP41_9NOCA|nr:MULTISPECIES: NAD(P)H-dependent glycerol-3-phosphate dehydrogenase [Rhodococcus]MBP1161669.1 glycerol-3-phosphate dehydrogenase (NAD(P)+) [Rhodococcus sp. PvR099]MCZ4555701.1 NAD(P)H-dependent glycerol-3-phosphate dehydrogenase [Rhodococcus maanshanensis]TJZ80237.1 NAD(P)H-dependent glycerol-3-phosphate dehydrogenase [Rhodococcus oryzae]
MARPVRVVVLGAGSWGTTVAGLAARNTPTLLWARDPNTADEVNSEHRNSRYLGDRALSPDLRATSDIAEAANEADVLVVGVPSHAVRSTLSEISNGVRAWVPVLSLAKGLEPGTRQRPTEVIAECLPGHPVGLLAGPNIAREIVDGLAAASVVATQDDRVATALQPLFASPVFRVYRNTDVLGCELGGILKNIVAIAAGMADGLGVGDNTRAMVLARGLAEMTRLGEAMGANPRTFAGLTGVGDLIATCISPASRNRRVGEALARGLTIEQTLAELGQVAEGVKTAPTVMELARDYDVEMPIAAEVEAVVAGRRTPAEAYRGLRRVTPGDEDDMA